MKTNKPKLVTASLLLGASALLSAPAATQGQAKGTLVVNGKPVAITQAYAYPVEDAFEKKPLTMVLLCDAAVPAAALRDKFEEARKGLVAAGKLSCVQQRINAEKQVINFGVRNKSFGARQPDGGSTEHLFEAKTFDGKTIAGRVRTKSPQMSFDDVPYSYDITFSTTIEPAR